MTHKAMAIATGRFEELFMRQRDDVAEVKRPGELTARTVFTMGDVVDISQRPRDHAVIHNGSYMPVRVFDVTFEDGARRSYYVVAARVIEYTERNTGLTGRAFVAAAGH